jgi:hypothetical protein
MVFVLTPSKTKEQQSMLSSIYNIVSKAAPLKYIFHCRFGQITLASTFISYAVAHIAHSFKAELRLTITTALGLFILGLGLAYIAQKQQNNSYLLPQTQVKMFILEALTCNGYHICRHSEVGELYDPGFVALGVKFYQDSSARLFTTIEAVRSLSHKIHSQVSLPFFTFKDNAPADKRKPVYIQKIVNFILSVNDTRTSLMAEGALLGEMLPGLGQPTC